MSELPRYRVRDVQGNIYGPADAAALRNWVGEGRIIAGMSIATEGAEDWVEVSTHPALADLFAPGPAGTPLSPSAANPYAASYSPNPVSYPPSGQQLNVLGLIAMISGIVSIVGCCCYGIVSIPAGIAAIIMATISLRQFRNDPDRYSGRGMAMAGLICGIVGIILGLAGIAFLIFAVLSDKHR